MRILNYRLFSTRAVFVADKVRLSSKPRPSTLTMRWNPWTSRQEILPRSYFLMHELMSKTAVDVEQPRLAAGRWARPLKFILRQRVPCLGPMYDLSYDEAPPHAIGNPTKFCNAVDSGAKPEVADASLCGLVDLAKQCQLRKPHLLQPPARLQDKAWFKFETLGW